MEIQISIFQMRTTFFMVNYLENILLKILKYPALNLDIM